MNLPASIIGGIRPQLHKIGWWGATLLGLIFFWSCATVTETGRSAVRLYSDNEMASLAQTEFQGMKTKVPVSQERSQNERVVRVGKRIAQVVADKIPLDRWEFVVFADDAMVNAFALPGGKVGVYTGLLRLASSDDELAAVIGHEVAHVTAQHGNERVSQATLAQLGGVAVQYGTRNKSDETKQLAMIAYSLGAQYGVLLPYSRTHEREADEIGILYAARAGYDPRAAITFWEKMAVQGGGQPPQFLSTHPSHGDRIQRLQEKMPQAMTAYENSPWRKN